jgi:hypothetical protein
VPGLKAFCSLSDYFGDASFAALNQKKAFDFHPPLADFTRHFSWRLFPKILECRSQKTFNPSRLSLYIYLWYTTLGFLNQCPYLKLEE